jgi:CHAD domain-containing protein
MATGSILTGSRVEHRDLGYWMDRVLKELGKVQAAPEADAVHDLRVAIRRCRSVAAVMKEVDPDGSWPEMRKLPRKLFRGLGGLRDVQVLEEWTKQLSAGSDPIRLRLLEYFAKQENEQREGALRTAAKFDQKAWKRSKSTLRRRARLVPSDGLAAECLALERLEAAKELHGKAFRSTKAGPWHALRIGIKKLRYTVESLLPQLHEKWGGDLKHVQDLLGEVHDLDVLAETIQPMAAPELQESRIAWLERILVERNNRVDAYRLLSTGKTNLWHEWRVDLPQDQRLDAAGLARLQVTVRALDGNLRRTGQVSRLAMRLFDGLAKVHAATEFRDAELRKITRAAARMHGIGVALGSKEPQKAARDFLERLAIPAGWAREDWRLMGMIVRYHRGRQPNAKHKGFARLSDGDRGRVSAAAGVLRLARMLRKCGVESATGLKLEKSVDALIVRVPGLIDTEKTAAGIAAGKHLLETCIKCPIILKAEPVVSNVVELEPNMHVMRAAAGSD